MSEFSPPFLPTMSLDGMHAPLEAELDAVWKEMRTSGAFILGAALEQFESAWAAYCGVAYAKGVGSGTDAIELALRALGVGPGDEVIVPASTFIATAAAVAATGAEPVFTDVDPGSLLLTGDHVAAAISPRTAAIIPVHLYGNVVDMDPVLAVAQRHGLAVVEDAAQAHGATYRGRSVGGLGHAGAFSHYPTKNLGAFGDAGSVVTDDAELAAGVRRIGNHGRATQSEVEYTLVGRTSRLDSLQAGVLMAKLGHLDDWVHARREIVAWYDELLPVATPRVTGGPVMESAPHLCCVRATDRDRVRNDLREAGIGTGVHYPDPVPRTAAFGGHRGAFPVAERAADELVSLPLWPGMVISDVERVVDALGSSLA